MEGAPFSDEQSVTVPSQLCSSLANLAPSRILMLLLLALPCGTALALNVQGTAVTKKAFPTHFRRSQLSGVTPGWQYVGSAPPGRKALAPRLKQGVQEQAQATFVPETNKKSSVG